jgi:hypothetical protein
MAPSRPSRSWWSLLLLLAACADGDDDVVVQADTDAAAESDVVDTEPGDTIVGETDAVDSDVDRDTDPAVDRDTDPAVDTDTDTDDTDTDTDTDDTDTDTDVRADTDVAVDTDPIDPLACALGVVQGAADAGSWSVTLPPSCSGNTPTCCPGGVPVDDCGPIVLDLVPQPGDADRLVVAPGSTWDDVTLRGRVATATPIPITLLHVECGLEIDSTAGTVPDVAVSFRLSRIEPPSGDSYVQVGSVTVTDLEAGDVAITGSTTCLLANLGVTFLTSQLADAVADVVQASICDSCPCSATP